MHILTTPIGPPTGGEVSQNTEEPASTENRKWDPFEHMHRPITITIKGNLTEENAADYGFGASPINNEWTTIAEYESEEDTDDGIIHEGPSEIIVKTDIDEESEDEDDASSYTTEMDWDSDEGEDGEDSEDEDDDDDDDDDYPENWSTQFKCHHCEENFSSYRSVKEHINFEHVEQEEEEEEEEDEEEEEEEEEEEQREDDVIDLCVCNSDCSSEDGENITVSEFIKQHMTYTKTKDKSSTNSKFHKIYECCLCEYTTEVSIVMKRHIMSKHLNMIPNQCKWCDFKSARRRCLVLHILFEHANDKPEECPVFECKAKHPTTLTKPLRL